MRLTELLTGLDTDADPPRSAASRREGAIRIRVHPRGTPPLRKADALSMLAALLASGPAKAQGGERTGSAVDAKAIERVLAERESLQSTGIGDGVAIPHGSLPELSSQSAALLVVPDGLDFDAIDTRAVYLVFAVLGPKRATGEHLKTLARISRLLRSREFRERLINAESANSAFELLVAEEERAA